MSKKLCILFLVLCSLAQTRVVLANPTHLLLSKDQIASELLEYQRRGIISQQEVTEILTVCDVLPKKPWLTFQDVKTFAYATFASLLGVAFSIIVFSRPLLHYYRESKDQTVLHLLAFFVPLEGGVFSWKVAEYWMRPTSIPVDNYVVVRLDRKPDGTRFATIVSEAVKTEGCSKCTSLSF